MKQGCAIGVFYGVILDFKLSYPESLFTMTAGQVKLILNFVLSVLFILSLPSAIFQEQECCLRSMASPLAGLLTK